MMAELKGIQSPDLQGGIVTAGPSFCVFVELFVGPRGSPGEESFEILVCSPGWLDEQTEAVVSGEYKLIMKEFSWPAVRTFVERRIGSIHKGSWTELAEEIGRFARWEFQDYPG